MVIQLLDNPPVISDEKEEIYKMFQDFDMKTDTFDHEEYEKVKRWDTTWSAKERCYLDDIILEFCNKALIHGRKPEQWSMLSLTPIPKSRDLNTLSG